jgi:hypothetical protein
MSSFTDLYNKMQSSDSRIQDKAVKDCLGINYYRENLDDRLGYVGCYKDNPSRAIPNYRGNVNSLDQCAEIAKGNGDNTLGLQYGGQCFTGKDSAYNKYGVESNTGNCPPLGGTWSNQVYTKGGKRRENKITPKGVVACGVNSGDQIYCNNTFSESDPTGAWNMLPGSLKHIAVNNNKVFGVNRAEDIYGADDSENPQWAQLPGHLKQISVSDNVVCGANRFDDIYCADNGSKQNPNWFNVPGKLKHVTVNKGKLYGANSNDDIYAADDYRNAQWTQVPGKLKQVSFDDNVVCGVNSGDEIYCADNGSKQNPNWQRLPGSLKYVSVKDRKLLGANSADQIWFADNYKSPNWKNIPGSLKQVELG